MITKRHAVTPTPISVQSQSSVAVGVALPPVPRMMRATPVLAPLKLTSSISHFVIG